MPLFDRDYPIPDLPPEIIEMANAIYERLKSRKVPEIILADPDTSLIIPNMVRSYLQAHLRRCLTFVEAGAAELDAKRPLAAELCSRALYENIATINDFAEKLRPLCEAADYKGVERHVSNAAFSTRVPSFIAAHGPEVKAPQILNQIDALNKRYPQFRQAYDHLSDIVHPNGLGAVIYFSKSEPGIIRFVDHAISPDRARTSLICATLLLLYMELAFVQIDEWLNKMSTDLIAQYLNPKPSTE